MKSSLGVCMTIASGFFRNNSQVAGQFAFSVLVGILGTTLIVLFLSTFLHAIEVAGFIPWIIGFNALVSGYSLVDKTRDQVKHKKLWSLVVGGLNVLGTYFILTVINIHLFGEDMFNHWDFLVFMIIGIVCSEIGATLAIRFFGLK